MQPDRLPRGCCGLADLLLARADGGEEGLAAAARLLAYEAAPRRPPPPPPRPAPVETPAAPATTPSSPVSPASLMPAPVWRVVARDPRKPREPSDDTTRKRYTGGDTLADTVPPARDLRRWSALMPALRGAFTERVDRHALDADRIVRDIGRGRMVRRLPRRQRLRWGRGIQIIVDRSQRLIPFQDDQDRMVQRLATLFPRHAVETALVFDGADGPILIGPDGDYRDYCLPEPGWLVAVLSDLGCLAVSPAPIIARWETLGRRLIAAGCRPVALMPCPTSRWRVGLDSWTKLPWEGRWGTGSIPPAECEARSRRLLRLLSLAIRVEPGLLRDIRLLLGAGADAGTEVDAWTSDALVGRSRVAGTFNTERANPLRREAAATETPALFGAVVACIQKWRAGLAPEVWYEELLNLPEDRLDALPQSIRDRDLPAARQYVKDLERTLDRPPGWDAWYLRVSTRASSDYHAQSDPDLRVAQNRLHWRATRGQTTIEVPPDFDPIDIPSDLSPITVPLRHRGDRIVAEPGGTGSPLATVLTRNGLVQVREDGEASDRTAAFWASGAPPSWATDWGSDAVGPWVTVSVEGTDGPVTQRLRWIPPGRFLMGSPEDEPGRFHDEGPQHEVTLETGFWLFDTPCTQALWQAVMGENPSDFKSPDRPVETVRWHDVQTFLQRINERAPGLDLTLPSEAQWEYACRAGEGPSPDLDAVAWYDTNSEGQTHPVGQKQPNAWGLHDMLGNVWEWCADHWHGTYKGAPADGSSWQDAEADTGADRVVRGGSWDNGARGVRAAYRFRVHPVVRFNGLGFRCSRVPVSPASGGAEPAEPASLRPAERPEGATPDSGGSLLRLREDARQAACPVPSARSFIVRTDCERLTVQSLERPPWAEAMGRDRFGLWVRIALEAAEGPPVTQRMRWIPPGRFMMGSPEDEPGRYDDEGPQHEVTLQQGFWLFDTPCTQALWQAVMGENPSKFKSPDRPVEKVSWNDAQTFLQRINDRIPGLGLTLPSEARWEYACRAGAGPPPDLGAVAWYDRNSGRETHPVGQKQANAWGLHDMLGNVWEWCADPWHETYDGAPADGTSWQDAGAGAYRVVRGGSWDDGARDVRAACRYGYHPNDRYVSLGFRCSRVQP
ncbi:formylglycine-generating enzyme family protein [Roseospira visakhapatnamensis]|uniref:Formylglycine-generating enzyme required for sulfatase activity n=1 Tax=Roseospira visakhapatnamensis TaxID=390880 RepID=A0A7W6RH95_9PROT|nr:formylglycine-generating enzyme family protein [Roseospira visakhapatnamensis]MBB4268004.1 formylglycine-generating enzyme required for sulfatase activity [Roseospira visakhapatnamensis]